VARVSGAREMVRRKPLFQRLGPPASGLDPKHLRFFADLSGWIPFTNDMSLMQARYVTGIHDDQ
jgi:hypothetical protein